MTIIEKLEKYFNTGSTDKQNKRRLGGLLVAITAILLVLSIVAVSIGGVVALVAGIVNSFDRPDDIVEGDGGVNTLLVDVAASDLASSAKFTTTVLENTVPANMTVSTFGDVKNNPYRFKNGVDKEGGYVYKATHKDGLQSDALTAFNSMLAAFHEQTTKDLVVWANDAYSTDTGAVNGSHYANALAVDIWYEYPDEANAENTKTAPIYGNTDFDWIFKNAYKYGFVRVSDATGEESIFRYVGLSHAKYIYDKQTKSKDTFYGLDSYLTDKGYNTR